MSEPQREYLTGRDTGDEARPTDAPPDHEADRFAAGVVAVTTAERAVVEAALACQEAWDDQRRDHNQERDAYHAAMRRYQDALYAMFDTARAVRLARARLEADRE